jgi:hypothetical protein
MPAATVSYHAVPLIPINLLTNSSHYGLTLGGSIDRASDP